MPTKKSNDGMEIIKKRFGIDPATDENVQAYADDFRIAQMVYDARQAAGLTQKELAEAIGTTENVVAELEDADYEGEALVILRRIAEALQMKLRIELVPAKA
jgi:ribosome-binding protein aMBF1 (putative translation factor)